MQTPTLPNPDQVLDQTEYEIPSMRIDAANLTFNKPERVNITFRVKPNQVGIFVLAAALAGGQGTRIGSIH